MSNVIYVDFKKEKPAVKDVVVPEVSDDFVLATQKIRESFQRLNSFMDDLRQQSGGLQQ